jgi:DNA-directed RNA polymerase subunit RPC12/RpoP
MPQTKYLAHCEECGHAYRVPSSERTYPCKECGGTVVVDADDGEPEQAELSDEEQEQQDFESRRLSQRHRHQESRTGLFVFIGIMAVIVLGGGGLYATGTFDRWFGGEKDLAVVVDGFAADWAAGDTAAVVAAYHPSGIDAFRERFETMVERGGWDAGLPAIEARKVEITEGTADAPLLGQAVLTLAGEPGQNWLDVGWQFEPAVNRWFIYDFKAAPPALGPRVAELQELWQQSSASALRPLFTKKNATRMIEIVGKSVKARRWTDFPTLRSPVTTGEAEAGTRTARLSGVAGPVETTFDTAQGPMTVKWVFSPASHEWYAVGFQLP